MKKEELEKLNPGKYGENCAFCEPRRKWTNANKLLVGETIEMRNERVAKQFKRPFKCSIKKCNKAAALIIKYEKEYPEMDWSFNPADYPPNTSMATPF